MRLDYVSPLPPVRSGIADYSLDLLPFLAREAEVRVIQLPGQPVRDDVLKRWQPVDGREWMQAPASDHLPLYQMGNNPYHREVEELALARPGAVTLHDLVLHHYLLGRTLGDANHDAYDRRLREEHGWVGEAVARPTHWGAFGDAGQFSLPAHRRLLRRQRGVLVHSAWAREQILDEEPDLAVYVVRMGVPPVEEISADRGLEFRRRHRIPESAFLLGSYGFQTPMKRPLQVLRAMLEPGMEQVHLLVAGQIAPTLELERTIHEFDLVDRVHVTGFLEFSDFEAAIAASDLALNLRYPSAGETSASLLRVLAVGKGAIISNYAQFAELPREIGVKVPVGDGEVPALVSALKELMLHPERLREMERNAREYVGREHQLHDAAREIVEACTEIAQRELPAARPQVVAPATSLTASKLVGEVSVETLGESGAASKGDRGELRFEIEVTNRGEVVWLPSRDTEGGVRVQLLTVGDDPESRRTIETFRLEEALAPGESGRWRGSVRRTEGAVGLELVAQIGPVASPGNIHPLWRGWVENPMPAGT